MIDINKILSAHWEAVEKGQALRNIAKRQVSRVTVEGVSYIVKTYRLGVFRRLLHLRVKNFSGIKYLDGLTPECLADECIGNWQVTVTRDAGTHDLFLYDKQCNDRNKLFSAFASAGELLAKIHQRNVFHGDTKTPNFVVNENIADWLSVLIVDCDKVAYFPNGLPLQMQAFNLAQFIQSIRKQCDVQLAKDLINEFLTAYRKERALGEDEWQCLKKSMLDIALSDRHIEKHTPENALKI